MKRLENSTALSAVAPTPVVKLRLRLNGRARRVPAKTKGAGSIPRITRLLALAHRIDGMIRSGELKNWAEAARLIGITRARMTQIANLMLLAPKIQDWIFGRAQGVRGEEPIIERGLRNTLHQMIWSEQKHACLIVKVSRWSRAPLTIQRSIR